MEWNGIFFSNNQDGASMSKSSILKGVRQLYALALADDLFIQNCSDNSKVERQAQIAIIPAQASASIRYSQ
jgi:hypothetical protein